MAIPTAFQNRAAFAIDCLIDSANATGAMVDVHFHFYLEDEAALVASDMATPPATTKWQTPDYLIALEFGPVPTTLENFGLGSWWNGASDGKGNTEKFTDGIPSTLPDNTNEWDHDPNDEDWITRWLIQDTEADLSGDLIGEGINHLNSEGFRIVLYGPTHQVGSASNAQSFWMGALWTTMIHPSEVPDKVYSRWKDDLEDVAATYLSPLAPWNPHPSKCPPSACSPCSQ